MKNNIIAILAALLVFILVFRVYAVPVGPTVTYVSNTTMGNAGGTMVNETNNGSTSGIAGGYIFTINLDSNQKNEKWKAYVGNVTGKFALSDSSGYAIYDWTLTGSVTGEVYATRASGTISWGSTNCSNLTHIEAENTAMNHGGAQDNITATFDAQDNDEFEIAGRTIVASTCYTTNLYVDGAAPGDDSFEEVLLYDGTNFIYAAIIENDHDAYMNSNEPYDFQMIVAEDGRETWSSSTPYYFYVELD
ncbi:MAG: hypothetical protein PHV16_03400 [Candidatus Nanoarchaeia archaeon]|nr:hypothetical protein [Candidatus Nanoarchaeia archaeon]